MAMENCLQLSTISAVRANALQSHRLFSSKEKVSLSTCKALIRSSVSSSSFALSFNRRCSFSTIACKASVNEVDVVTDCNWNDRVVASDTLVLVDFWAPWCGPCRMIAPVVDELAREYAGKIACYKLNTDDCPNIASQYGIRSIPTVLFFKDGEKKESVIGAVPKSTLTATIEKYLTT